MQWKKSLLKIAYAVKENFSPQPGCGEKKDASVSDRWRSGIKICWHVGGNRFEPVYGSFFFVSECCENFFTAKNRKSYKNSPHSTLKDADALQWKIFFTAIHS